jgi:hypothetical protein
MRGRALRACCAALLWLLAAATPATATFHLIQVREVYPGSAANPDAEYVELQMWSSGQQFVAGHVVRSYGPTGKVTGTSPFPGDVSRGANQSTLLLATPQAEAEFGIVADAPLAPAGQLGPGGGAACWETIDCVAWGGFSGSLPSPAGAPAAAAGIPDGMALRRSIDRNCPTALDPEDDSNNSVADFAVVIPSPRPNSATPTEQPCTGGGQDGSRSQGGQGAPQTILRHKPPKRTADRTPTFRFVAAERGARFQCKLDARRYRRCRSPFTTARLAFGPHRFRVRAIDSQGQVDPTPASYRFRVVRPG